MQVVEGVPPAAWRGARRPEIPQCPQAALQGDVSCRTGCVGPHGRRTVALSRRSKGRCRRGARLSPVPSWGGRPGRARAGRAEGPEHWEPAGVQGPGVCLHTSRRSVVLHRDWGRGEDSQLACLQIPASTIQGALEEARGGRDSPPVGAGGGGPFSSVQRFAGTPGSYRAGVHAAHASSGSQPLGSPGRLLGHNVPKTVVRSMTPWSGSPTVRDRDQQTPG